MQPFLSVFLPLSGARISQPDRILMMLLKMLCCCGSTVDIYTLHRWPHLKPCMFGDQHTQSQYRAVWDKGASWHAQALYRAVYQGQPTDGVGELDNVTPTCGQWVQNKTLYKKIQLYHNPKGHLTSGRAKGQELGIG